MDNLVNITTPPTENVSLPMNSTLTSTFGDTSSLWIIGDAITTESYVSTAMNATLPTWNSTMDLINVTTARPTPDPSTCLIFVPDKVLNSINDKVVEEILMPSLVFTIMMFVIGVPGNLVVFYVYWRRWRKTTSRLFIMALAAFDLCNCVSMAFEIDIILNVVQFNHPSRCKFARMFTFLMNNSSSFTLLVIAIDRYMRICRPLKPAMTNIHAKIAVAVAVVMAIAAAFPAAVLYGTQTRIMKTHFPNICIKMHLCLIEDGYTTSNLPLTFTSFLLAGNLLIDVILIFCYICIAFQVIRRGQFNDGCLSKGRENSISSTATDHDVLEPTDSPYKATPIVLARQASLASSEVNGDINKAEGKKLTRNVNGGISRSTGGASISSKSSASFKRSQFKKQRSMSTQSIESRRTQMYKTTLMLFLVTLLFMVSFIPYCVIVIIRYIQPNYYETLTKGGKACFQIFLRTYLLSSALNPVIYSFLSEQFRNETIKIFKSTFCKKKYAFTR